MVLKDELNIPYEDAALLIEHLEQVCNKAEVITKRMERNVQEIKLSIEIERNMLALAQREEQEMCGSHTLQLVEKLYDNIKNTSLVTKRTSFITDVFPLHHQILEFM